MLGCLLKKMLLKFTQYINSIKASFPFHAVLACLIKKIDYVMKVINVKKKKMIPLTHTVLESCAVLSQESCHVCKKKFEDKYANDKNIE